MLKLIVLKTHEIDNLKAFYELLGLKFILEKHGKGTAHYSCQLKNNVIFEIYPIKPSNKVNRNIRLGFEVENIELVLEKVKSQDGEIISEARVSNWGKSAIIKDIDGRKIELYE